MSTPNRAAARGAGPSAAIRLDPVRQELWKPSWRSHAVAAWADVAATELESSSWADGCPVATVALETAHTSDALAAACGAALDGWRVALSESIFDRGVARREADGLATLILAGIEGALLLARAGRDADPLRIVGHELALVLRVRVP